MPDTDRRYDADWLRVFATYLLFVFHVAKVFDVAPFYHIKNADSVPSLDLLTGFIHLWHMPLLFALAGWALCASLRARGADGMVRERVRRLLVPLVCGIVLICPVLKYYELSSGLNLSISGLETGVEFHESFLAYWPTFFAGLDRFTWAHLWFIAYLLTFTVLYRKRCIRRLALPAADVPPTAARLYRPLIALVLIQTSLRLIWPGSLNLVWDWANFAYYSLYFLMGFEVGRSPAWERTIVAEAPRAGGIALVACIAMAAYFTLVLGGNVALDPSSITVMRVLSLLPLLALTAVGGFGVIVALVGFALRHLRRGNRLLRYLSESSLAVYILHQAGIVVPGYYLLQLELPVSLKFPLLLALSVVATLSVYHWIVRPVPALRVVFGMSPKRRGAPATPSTRAAAAASLVVVAMLSAASLAAADEIEPTGLWWAEGGAAQVHVREENGELRGAVAWLRSPFEPDGCPLRDKNHPDEVRRDDPVIGLELLHGFRADPDRTGTWTGGHIYDPGSGYTFKATLTMDDADRMRVRGYVGISLFGRTTTWIRVGSEMCRIPES